MRRKQKLVKGLSRREMLKYGIYSGLAAGLSSSLWLSGCGKRRGGKRPNVILIVLDTARVDRFSCMGYRRLTSPNIDFMAAEGIIYESAYSTCCWTLPSHGSLFTGLYPTQAGATSETLQLPFSNTVLAGVLKEAGYDTAGFSCNGWISKERGFAQGFDEFHEMWRRENRPDVMKSQGPIELTAMERVTSWIEQREAVKNPFYVFINLNCAHLPYQPPEPFLSRFVGNRGYNNEEVNRVAVVKSCWAYLGGEIKLSERDFSIMSDLYDGEVALADRCVGQIVERLRDSGILDDTVVIVTSDHGENLGEHGRIDHMLSMYETTLRIPLFIRYPIAFKGGIRIHDLVSLVDIAPTILDLCGVQDGMENLRPSQTSLACNERLRRTFVVAENERPLTGIALMKDRYPNFDTSTIDYRMRAIRAHLYKLIWNIGGSVELFNLQTDAGELHNLANVRVQTRNKLHKILTNWMSQIPSAGDISLLESQDKESLEMLRSLGYME
ncbi:MAG: sulfatase [Planctomycetota bacterium]|jgi:arylsulfatase A-like enzyme